MCVLPEFKFFLSKKKKKQDLEAAKEKWHLQDLADIL